MIDQIETGSFAVAKGTPAPDLIRVVSWNIARGSQFDEVAAFLAGTNADLILLQEADRYARRTGYRNVAAELAKHLKMNYAFGAEFHELSQSSEASPAYHGQATLSPLPLSDCRIIRFSRQSKFWHPYWWVPKLSLFQRRLGGRMALLTHVTIGNRTLAAYSVHLESRNSDDLRRSQLGELIEDTRRYDEHMPVILAGDFNFDLTETSAVFGIEEMCFENPFNHGGVQRTVRSLGREAAIDWVLTRGPLHATAARVDTSVCASDHYPLLLTLRVP